MSNGVLDKFEKKWGLPPFKQMVDLASGDTGKRLERVMDKALKLNQGSQDAKELLTLLHQMSQDGTLDKFEKVVRDLRPMVSGRKIQLFEKLIERMDKLEKLLREFTKEEEK